MLKSIVGPRNHKRTPSKGITPPTIPSEDPDLSRRRRPGDALPVLPLDHPDSKSVPLGEMTHNQQGGPRSSRQPEESGTNRTLRSKGKILHKKTLSSISLSSLAAKHKDAEPKTRSRSKTGADAKKQPKKSKSHTNLGALLPRSRSTRSKKQYEQGLEDKDKENQTPPTTSEGPPPIWSQFASVAVQEPVERRSRCSDDERDVDVEQQISLYTPVNYSPSKQRNFDGAERPTLGRRIGVDQKPRPRSAYLPFNSSFKDIFASVRKSSHEQTREPEGTPNGLPKRLSKDAKQRTSAELHVNSGAPVESPRFLGSGGGVGGPNADRRGSKVLAAVAAFNDMANGPRRADEFEAKKIEGAFEALLNSRNVPLNMREKLRSLDTHIKADFIKQDKAESQTTPNVNLGEAFVDKDHKAVSSRPVVEHRAKTTDPIPSERAVAPDQNPSSPGKRARPRSRTFTFSKNSKDGSSPAKKQKSNASETGGMLKSVDFSRSSSTTSLVSLGDGDTTPGGSTRLGRSSVPEDFVQYLQKFPEPQMVEVGKMHKLRLVLRNERVAWVDSFISMGGMSEIVALLHRVMALEWREEHEDQLLHEVLLCLKALCTTELALERLNDIESSLFPGLLGMLFDQERKGPSDFTTRGIIMALLFTHLQSSSEEALAQRAKTVLSYLQDRGPSEEAQPPGFISSMHHPRPYRVWCKEFTNVTKEVFWIFLHNHNVVSLPQQSPPPGFSFAAVHFPKERPPVPAAPYVGGVEWDATNYLATHLDLLNALVASLATCDERNALRQELRDSGWEKILGGSVRTCKEKFYGAVHDGLRTWVAAAKADGWAIGDVRNGPPREERSPVRQSPRKKKQEPPMVELPKLDLDGGNGGTDGWL
ncbi:MAG: hypothetical protein M1833_004518 [Piccolia ochrophora]|nr:MAG: hypothetical protein M1833_004518 [Piccolia ochrophora]